MLMESVCHLSGLLGTVPQQGLFVEKSYQEPDGSIIQPDDTVKMIRRPAVVPGAHVLLLQEAAAYIFSKKNAGHVDESPLKKRCVFHFLHNRCKEGRASVDGEHPEGGSAGQLQIADPEGMQTGPEKLHGPADHSASKKILSYHKR